MNDDGHASPERAAMTGFPEAHCRVVASRSSEDHAYVLLDTGSPGQPYLYGVNCFQCAGQWFERGSSNGPGWEQTGHDPDVGTLSLWADVPREVDHVRINFNGGLIEEPVVVVSFVYYAAASRLLRFQSTCRLACGWTYGTSARTKRGSISFASARDSSLHVVALAERS